MHERTQRRVCRIVYVLACVVPTVLTVVGVIYFHRPWQERDWQRLLENNLHVRVSISGVTASRPGERQLYQIRFADLHSNSTLATIDKLHLLPGDSLQANQVEVSYKEVGELARILHGWLSADSLPQLNIQANSLLLSRAADQTCKLANVVITVMHPTPLSRKLIVRADVLDEGSVQLQIEQTEEGPWNATLDCQKSKLPAWLFADFLPGASRWHAAQFTGSMKLRYANASLDGTLIGKFAPIALQEWLGKDSPHKLSATAQIQFENLRWQGRRIAEAQGSIAAEPGLISRSLTTALTKSLFCVPGKKLTEGAEDESLSFEKLACKFTLNPAGLTATGNCSTLSPDTSGCLLTSGGEPLLLQPTYSIIPLPYFVQVFCPLDTYWFPGIRKAADLAETLPLAESENLRK